MYEFASRILFKEIYNFYEDRWPVSCGSGSVKILVYKVLVSIMIIISEAEESWKTEGWENQKGFVLTFT